MAIKYNLEFLDDKSNEWKVTFYFDGYTGDSTDIIAVDRNPLIIRRESDADDIMSPIVYSSALISVYNQGNINVDEIYALDDKGCTVTIYKNNEIKLQGFLTSDGITEDLIDNEPVIDLTIIDGMKLLVDIDFILTNRSMPQDTFDIGLRSPISVIAECLYNSDGLKSRLPLVWNSSLKNKLADEESLSSSMIGADGSLFVDTAGNRKTYMFIMEGILKAMSARMYQEGGKWVIDRIEDIIEPNFVDGRQIDIANSTNSFTSEERIKRLSNSGDFIWIDENAQSFTMPPVGEVEVTYNPVRYKNILPNGSMNSSLSTSPIPRYWRATAGTGIVDQSKGQSLVGDNGDSFKADFIGNGVTWGRVYLSNKTNPLDTQPSYIFIDTKNSYTEMEFGFTYSITRAPTKTVNGRQYISDSAIIHDAFYPENDITSYPLRFMVTYYKDSVLYHLTEFGHWVERPPNSEWRYGISANIDDKLIQVGDIVSVNMNKHTIKLPQIDNGDFVNSGGITVQFFCGSDIEVYLDDVYVNVIGDNEVHKATNNISRSKEKKEIDLEISSSPNGFFLSNFMKSWDMSKEDYLHVDGSFEGSLSEIAARSAIKVMGNDSKVIDTSIYGDKYSFGDRWKVDIFPEKTFLETRSEYNVQTCTSTVTLHEVSLVNDIHINSSIITGSKGKADSDRWM